MLKWSCQTRRRFNSQGESLDASSSDSGSSICEPPSQRPQPRFSQVSRPQSIALDRHEQPSVILHDQERLEIARKAFARSHSNPNRAGKANRHSQIVSPTTNKWLSSPTSSQTDSSESYEDQSKICERILQDHDTSVLQISTAEPEKGKRANFWKNLRDKAAGKKGKNLEKSRSLTNLPQSVYQLDNQSEKADLPTSPQVPENTLGSRSTSPTNQNVHRRRSFKSIKRQNECKKPKPFSRCTDAHSSFDSVSTTSSDSMHLRRSICSELDSESIDHDSDGLFISPIDLDNDFNVSYFNQQFSDVILKYLDSNVNGVV